MLLARIRPDALARELTLCGWKVDDLRQASDLSWGTLAKAARGAGISPQSAHAIGAALARQLGHDTIEVLGRILQAPVQLEIPA